MDAADFVAQGKIEQSVKDLAPLMQELQQKYPVLSRHKFFVRSGDGLDNSPGGYSETYPAWDDDNPNPGFHTIALFDKGQALDREAKKQLLLGETFHILGGTDPRTNQPVDPIWNSYKKKFADSLTPEQIDVDTEDYSSLNQRGITYKSMSDYYQINRIDAYFRGHLTPITKDEADDWAGTYTPEQLGILEGARNYLEGNLYAH